MNKERLYIVGLALAVALMFASISKTTTYVWETDTHTIRPGETLWSICKKHCPNDMDMWEYINLVKERNDMEKSTIYEGEALTILIDRR